MFFLFTFLILSVNISIHNKFICFSFFSSISLPQLRARYVNVYTLTTLGYSVTRNCVAFLYLYKFLTMELKNKMIVFRVSENDYNLLKRKSYLLKTTMSALILSSVKGISTKPLANRELLAELRKIGVNINQISASINSNPKNLSNRNIINNLEDSLLMLRKLINDIYNDNI